MQPPLSMPRSCRRGAESLGEAAREERVSRDRHFESQISSVAEALTTLQRKQKELRRPSRLLANRGRWWATCRHSRDRGAGRAWRKNPGVCESAGGHARCTAGCARLERRGAFRIDGYTLELSADGRLDFQGTLLLSTLYNENTEAVWDLADTTG